jgi:hypothetical protein
MKSETPRTDAAQVPDNSMREMVVSAGMARELERELAEIKTVLDESGTAIGNGHETYSLSQRIKNLTTARDYFCRQTDKARNELAQLKTSVAAMPNEKS